VADRSRAKKGAGKYINDDVASNEFYRGIVDATIGATYAHDALIAMGYGVTFVGGVTGFANEIEKRFNLPKDAQVIVGLSIGKATKRNEFKPKMNKVFVNSYDQEANFEELKRYDEELKKYYASRGQENDFINYQAYMVGPNAPEAMASSFGKAGKYVISHLEQAKK